MNKNITKENKANNTTEAQLFHPFNHHKWIPNQFLGGKTLKNVQIDPHTIEIWPTELYVTLSVHE